MRARTGRFGRSERLRRSKEFQHVSRVGWRAASRHFVFLVAPSVQTHLSRPTCNRLGVTVSRRVGNSVARNRVKRVIREWYRQTRNHRGPTTAPLDLVVIARRGANELASAEIYRELAGLAARKAEPKQ